VNSTLNILKNLKEFWAIAHLCDAFKKNPEPAGTTYNRNPVKEFGAPGYEATVKELDNNLLRMDAVELLKPSKENKNIRYEALNYLMSLKTKIGKIKARGCVDGRPQREYISKLESSSPTEFIYALMTSCVGHNRRKKGGHL
jgi:hypothetical protein